jgi:SAM-dependent methyltransferase
MADASARELDAVYASRFPQAEQRQKQRIWPEIVRYLSRWIAPDAPVLDIACDRGYFIRNVTASDRWATDLRDMRADLPSEIHFVQADGLTLDAVLPPRSFGTIFMSNYLEHLADSDAVVEQLRVCARLLRPDGRVLVLQPNIRLVGGRYWDFIDHHVALTEKSLVEAGDLAGLRTVALKTRFLPYSTKSRLPSHPALVRTYLRVPAAWRLLGKQTLYVAEQAP